MEALTIKNISEDIVLIHSEELSYAFLVDKKNKKYLKFESREYYMDVSDWFNLDINAEHDDSLEIITLIGWISKEECIRRETEYAEKSRESLRIHREEEAYKHYLDMKEEVRFLEEQKYPNGQKSIPLKRDKLIL
jgi:hypothetical protein